MIDVSSGRAPNLNAPWRLSSDAILFIALWAAQFWSSSLSGFIVPTESFSMMEVIRLTRVMAYAPVSTIMIVVLCSYIVADVALSGPRQFRIKLIAIWILIIAFVFIPTVAAIFYRHSTAPYRFIHDGAIQLEEAIKFLLAGKNPYVENYTETPMALWSFHEQGFDVNPALYHLPYLPFTFLVSVPVYLVSQFAIGWFDQRLVFLIMFLFLIPILLQIGGTPSEKLGALMMVALNPLFVPYFVEGRNDVVVLFWIVGSVLFLQRNQPVWSGLFLACAVGSKQTAWFLVPFFLLFVLKLSSSDQWQAIAPRAKQLAPGAIWLALILFPFLIWNPAAFVEDTINFQSGISANALSYPVKSLGLGDLLVGFGIIQSNDQAFPFSLLQILFGGLTLGLLLRKQLSHNTLGQILFNYAVLFFVSAFFSRTFNDNHLGFALILLLLPSLVAEPTTQKSNP
ncbi:MAG: hypothetical protein HZB51_03810 [Chloroflexi bacterium]|nr:hypothetical protein [Chloroflexota bacterium]